MTVPSPSRPFQRPSHLVLPQQAIFWPAPSATAKRNVHGRRRLILHLQHSNHSSNNNNKNKSTNINTDPGSGDARPATQSTCSRTISFGDKHREGLTTVSRAHINPPQRSFCPPSSSSCRPPLFRNVLPPRRIRYPTLLRLTCHRQRRQRLPLAAIPRAVAVAVSRVGRR